MIGATNSRRELPVPFSPTRNCTTRCDVFTIGVHSGRVGRLTGQPHVALFTYYHTPRGAKMQMTNRSPRKIKMLMVISLLIPFAFSTSEAWSADKQAAPSYDKKATWAETMLATRAEYLRWCKGFEQRQQQSGAKRSNQPAKEFQRLWQAVTRDFPQQAGAMQRELGRGETQRWFEGAALERQLVDKALDRLEPHGRRLRQRLDSLVSEKVSTDDPRWLELYEQASVMYAKLRGGDKQLRQIAGRLKAMGGKPAELQEEFEELLHADVPASDPRWSTLTKKADGLYKRFRNAHKDALARIGRAPQMLGDLASLGADLNGRYTALSTPRIDPTDPRWSPLLSELEARYARYVTPRKRLEAIDFDAVRRAIRDMAATFPGQYPRADEYLKRLADFEQRVPALQERLATGEQAAYRELDRLLALKREALLANPGLDFDRLLLVKRKAAGKLGLPQNWQGNCALPKTNYDNEIAVLSPPGVDGRLTTLYRPEDGSAFVGDVDLHFDAGRLLFSMPGGEHQRWQIWEIGVDGKDLRQVTPGKFPDVDNYDACYLPDGRIIFASTRCFQGVPCVGGNNTVANLCIMNADGTGIRQLCFDQDHNWCPTVLNNGRVLYSRWEYSDAPHYFTRLLFHMNPDGTSQMEYYGSNSPWPNSMFYARPIPGHPTQVVAVISGHHGVPRMGELILFDPAKGRHQADGAVQRIPGYGEKVEPVIGDGIVNGSWPRFLHPYPLSAPDNRGAGKYFLVSCQPTPQSLWGIYLVDTFDNRTLVCEQPGYAMLEPVPLRKTSRPPVVPDRVDPSSRQAVVYLSDVYFGNGLKGVPNGTVKRLRIYEQHFAYPKMGGHIHIGIDGPWDAKRILGTVPVESDGSASFTVPANTPIAVQPLDEKGRALQIMRSWFTAMPGETLSCVGCHESQNSSPPSKLTLATSRAPSRIKPWYGPARGFSFKREIQPVLDEYCVGCHDGSHEERPNFSGGEPVLAGKRNHRFTPSYVALHPYVRRPGPESDYFMQRPLEFHARTSELVQMLEKGHHNVRLDDEAWDRLATWIDLNVPDHGTWHEYRDIAENYRERRLQMRALYANRPEDPEEILESEEGPVAFVRPQPLPKCEPKRLMVPGWPFDADEARRRQESLGIPIDAVVKLGDDVSIDLALVPPGEFAMGSDHGEADERPTARVKIARPFYLGTVEVTNRQYAAFAPTHDSAYISMTNKDQSRRGHPVNGPDQPAVRVTWHDAEAFCRWLSQRTGRRFRLPTEAEWEWACRAGSDAPFSFGTSETDFSPFANLADRTLEKLALRDSPKWHPRDNRFNDAAMVTVDVGRYEPNAWGLRDMHGNVAEWTCGAYRPYPYDAGDGREDPDDDDDTRVIRGGSWYDRPHRATASFRWHYPAWQGVYNVGFRVVMETE